MRVLKDSTVGREKPSAQLEEGITNKKKNTYVQEVSRNKTKDAPPAGAFVLFMEDFKHSFNMIFPDRKSAVTEAGAAKWRSMSPAEKSPYWERAAKNREEYKAAMMKGDLEFAEKKYKLSLQDYEKKTPLVTIGGFPRIPGPHPRPLANGQTTTSQSATIDVDMAKWLRNTVVTVFVVAPTVRISVRFTNAVERMLRLGLAQLQQLAHRISGGRSPAATNQMDAAAFPRDQVVAVTAKNQVNAHGEEENATMNGALETIIIKWGVTKVQQLSGNTPPTAQGDGNDVDAALDAV